MLTDGIGDLLKGEATIATLAGCRITAVRLPAGSTFPAMTYHVIGGSSDPTFETSGMQRVRVQFDWFAKTYRDAALGREALRLFLNGYRGLLSDGTFVQDVELIQSMDFDEQDAREFRCMSEYYVMYTFPTGF